MSDLGNKKVMADNLNYYMRLHGKSRQDICNSLGFKYTTFCDWLNAKTYPRIDKIEMLANYFGVSKSDLVESKSQKNNDFSLSDKEKRLVEAYRNHPEMQTAIDKMLDIDTREFSVVDDIADEIRNSMGKITIYTK